MEHRLAPGYNCCHFLCDAWLDETGESIRQTMVCFLAGRDDREARLELTKTLRRLPTPIAPCVVLWRRRGVAPHVGLYMRGTVLHLTDSGPIRQLLAVARLGYTSERYYAPR